MYSTITKISFASLLSFVVLVVLTSCASLSESECRAADWEIIGLEDGSKGRSTSHIGKHRKACADYNIAPNLEAYSKGHASGLRQFCTEQNGYNQGVRGHSNANVCPSKLVGGFNRGYQKGFDIYQKTSEIKRLRSGIESREYRLHEISEIKVELEEEIISNTTREYRRRELLKEIKALERESEALHYEIDEMTISLARLEESFGRLRR